MDDVAEDGRVVCPLCGEEVDAEILEYHRGVEEHVLDLIRSHNPSWVRTDGSCPKAREYYLSVVLGREVDPA